MQSKVSSAESAAASRGDSSDADAPVRLYRFGYILPLRALLRVKVVQLALGVGVVLPVLSVLASGTLPTLAEGAVVAAVSTTKLTRRDSFRVWLKKTEWARRYSNAFL